MSEVWGHLIIRELIRTKIGNFHTFFIFFLSCPKSCNSAHNFFLIFNFQKFYRFTHEKIYSVHPNMFQVMCEKKIILISFTLFRGVRTKSKCESSHFFYIE